MFLSSGFIGRKTKLQQMSVNKLISTNLSKLSDSLFYLRKKHVNKLDLSTVCNDLVDYNVWCPWISSCQCKTDGAKIFTKVGACRRFYHTAADEALLTVLVMFKKLVLFL